MTSFCMDACIICDIDGFQGRHEATIVGESPPGFAGECTFVSHNMQWIAFIAGSEDLEVQMTVSNCTMDLGLEFGLYSGRDCSDFKRISNCFGGAAGIIRPGGSGIIKNIEPLIIGQYYYIVMDGGRGDNCDWTFTVIDGSTQVTPLDTSGEIEGFVEVCPNVEQIYRANAPVGATEFKWELDGRDLGINEPEIPINFENTGLFTLCMTAFNACAVAPPTCKNILVKSIPPTNLGKVRQCDDEPYEVADTILTTTGFYQFNLKTASGCDSLVIVDFEAVAASFTDLGKFNICDDDENGFPIGDKVFFTGGVHTEILPNSLGCDSTVVLELGIVVCDIKGRIDANEVRCKGEKSGSLVFAVTEGTPPFTYNWERIGGIIDGNGNITNLEEQIVIDGLGAGTYSVTIQDNFEELSDQRILITAIKEPTQLAVTWQRSDYNGFPISCFGANDGSLEITPSGGIAPYTYLWENGSEEIRQRALETGLYNITLTDAVGCNLVAAEELTAPAKFDFLADFQNASCDGLASGQISVLDISGGVEPYSYNFNDEGYSPSEMYTGLTEGAYIIKARDANACEETQSGILSAPIIPVFDLGEDVTIELADAYELSVNVLTSFETAIWRNNLGLSCYDCTVLTANPTNRTTYALTLTSEDDCSITDSLTIHISKVRDVYVPTVFSPNNDGINDWLTIFGGPEVLQIKSFRVYSRWGEQIYERNDFPPNESNAGWDGIHQGQNFGNTVYIWMAEIEFIDGETLVYSGDVAVVR